MKTVKGFSKLANKQTHRRRQHYGDEQRKKGVGQVEEGKRGINGDGRRIDLGWWTHNTIYR